MRDVTAMGRPLPVFIGASIIGHLGVLLWLMPQWAGGASALEITYDLAVVQTPSDVAATWAAPRTIAPPRARSGGLRNLRRLVDQALVTSRNPGAAAGRGEASRQIRALAGAALDELRSQPMNHLERDVLARQRRNRRFKSPDNRKAVHLRGKSARQRIGNGRRAVVRRRRRTHRVFAGPSVRKGRSRRALQPLPLAVAGQSQRGVRAQGRHLAETAQQAHALRKDGASSPSPKQESSKRSPTAPSQQRARQASDPSMRQGASVKRAQDLLDMARASARGSRTGRGQGALAGRLGASDGLAKGKAVWLNTVDRRYLDYFRKLYQRIHPKWKFPKTLEILMEQGEVLVEFAVRADGVVEYISIRRSSGYPAFDANAVAAIREAGPFQPLPRSLGRRLRIVAPFEFANPLVR